VIPKGTRTAFRAEAEQSSERSDAGTLIVEQVFGFVKENLSGAERRQAGTSEERGMGKRAQFLFPPHHGRDPACESAGNGAGSEGRLPIGLVVRQFSGAATGTSTTLAQHGEHGQKPTSLRERKGG
jgi:hypothetical protein